MTSILVENFNRYNANISWLNADEQIGKPIRSGAHELEIGEGKKVGFTKGKINKTVEAVVQTESTTTVIPTVAEENMKITALQRNLKRNKITNFVMLHCI